MINFRKQYQRKFNKIVKDANKNIAADNLWKGRFVFKQIDARFIRFEDNSGGILRVVLRGFDKETGFYKDYWIDYAPFFCNNDYTLWETINNFIVEDGGVWDEEPRPSLTTAIDYTKTPMPKTAWTAGRNYYKKYRD